MQPLGQSELGSLSTVHWEVIGDGRVVFVGRDCAADQEQCTMRAKQEWFCSRSSAHHVLCSSPAGSAVFVRDALRVVWQEEVSCECCRG